MGSLQGIQPGRPSTFMTTPSSTGKLQLGAPSNFQIPLVSIFTLALISRKRRFRTALRQSNRGSTRRHPTCLRLCRSEGASSTQNQGTRRPNGQFGAIDRGCTSG